MTKRILIIDDEVDIREVVRVSLEEFAGWQTITAASGEEGLQIAKAETLDAILLDVSMPDMDGFQVYQALQSNPYTHTIPIILLTAKALPSDQRRFAALNVAGVIIKPFDPLTVWNQVADIMQWKL
ncbi:response regulator [Egbenema bharatensis]|uniref:response regulator n=1 Tax=Egbenema bharatensis TaxID=3463334 RepID=UPI003A8B13B0